MSDAKYISEFRALFGENKLRSTSTEYYEWKILRNPHQEGKICLERMEGIIVGSETITPKKISTYGKEQLQQRLVIPLPILNIEGKV